MTLNPLLATYCNSGLAERAENCFAKAFPRYQVSPDVFSYLALLRMRRKGKHTCLLHTYSCLCIRHTSIEIYGQLAE
jgi:hypothetical protein